MPPPRPWGCAALTGGRAASLVALLAAVLIPIPCAFYKWGKIVRLRSPMLQKLQREKLERGE